MSSAQVETAPSSMAVPPPPPPPPAVMKKNQQPLPAPSSGSNRQSPPMAGRQRSSSLSSAPSSSVSPTSSSTSVPTKSISSSSLGSETSSLPPLVPHYTKPAILGLPPSAVLTKQEMDFRANLLNPNNDLFWTARGLIRPPVLADALAQGHAILKHEGHLTQKQGGRRLSAQYGRSGGNGPSVSLTSSSTPSASLPLGFGAAVVNPTSVTATVQSSWRSAAPAAVPAPSLPSHVTKEEMDFRANRLNPNNDVFWTSRGLIRPPVLADALAQGHAILQHEGHLTQTQSHKGRGRLNSLPQSSLYATADSRASAEPRRSVSGQGLPGSSISSGTGSGRSSSWRSTGERERESQPMAMRRRASTTGSMMNRPPALDGSVTKEEVDLRANLMNPNNSIFWTSRGLTRPADLQEALAKGHAVLEAEGHVTHNTGGGTSGTAGGGRSRSWNRRGSRTELHGPPAVSPLVAAAQRQWSTPFLAPNAGAGPLGAPPSTLTARSGGLPGAAWVHASGGSGPVPSTSRHPDWQASSNIAAQRRRYSLPPPGFELFTPPAHFGLFRPPLQAKQAAAAMPIVREGAADGEWDKMDAEAAAAAAARPLHSSAIPILKPTAADLAKNKAESSSWRKAAPSATKTTSADEEAKAMKQEDKKTTTATATSSTAAATASVSSKLSTSSGSSPTRVSPSEPTTPASEKPASPSIDKVGSLAWQLTQVKLRTRRPSEARESEHVTKSATA